MPRRRPDQVIEHRISLSDFERAKVNQVQAIAAANVGLDAFTGIAQAAGTALAGGGVFLAAFVLMKWKGPEILAEVINKTNGALDTVADVILPGTPVALRREAQDLAKRRGDIAKREATYCSFSSEKYDANACSQVQMEKDQYFADLEAFQEIMKQNAAIADLVYAGLGDVKPDDYESGWNPLNWDWTKLGDGDLS